METASRHKLGLAAETGPGRAGTALVTTAQRPKAAAVRAHRVAASPAVSGSLREQTGGGEEERDERERGEDRWGGAERGDEGEEGPLVYWKKSLKYFLFVFLLAFCYDLLSSSFTLFRK